MNWLTQLFINIFANIPLTLLAWLPTIFFVLAVVFGVFRGMLRGTRKSTVLLIKSLIALGITFLLYLFLFAFHPEHFNERFIIVFNNFAGSGAFQSLFGLDYTVTSITSIGMNIAWSSLESMMGSLIDFLPEEIVYAYIAAMTETIVRLIVFIIFAIFYFILNKIVLWIVYLIFFSEGKRKKKINKKYKRGLIEEPYRKKRIGGGVIGGLAATFKALIFLSFFTLISFVITGGNFNSDGVHNQTDEEVSREMMAITNLYNFFMMSNDTGILRLLNNQSAMPFFMFFADYVTSGRMVIEGEDTQYILLREELAALTNITNILMTHIIENNLVDIGDSQSSLDFDEILMILVQSDDFEEVIIDAFSRFGNTVLINGLVRHTIDSLFKGFIQTSDNRLLEIFFGNGERGAVILTNDIFNGHNFDVVLNMSFRIIELFNNIVDNFTQISSVNLEELLRGLSDNAHLVEDIIDDLLYLSFLNNANIYESLDEAIRKALSYILEEIFDGHELFNLEALNYINFICKNYGLRNGELGNIINLTSDILLSGILRYMANPQENVEQILNLLTTIHDNDGFNLTTRLLNESMIAHLVLSNFIMNIEIGNDVTVIIPQRLLELFGNSTTVKVICKDELVVTIHAFANLINNYISIEEFQQDFINAILYLLENETDVVLDLFESILIQVIVANIIAEIASETLNFHENLIFIGEHNDVSDQSLEIWLDQDGNYGEVRNLINALVALNMLDILVDILGEDGASESQLEKVIFDILETLDKEVVTIVYQSVVLRNFISYTINDLIGNLVEGDLLRTHKLNMDVVTTCYITEESIFTKDELYKIVVALGLLKDAFEDGIENIDLSFVLNLINPNYDDYLNIILKSYVMWHLMAVLLYNEVPLSVPQEALVPIFILEELESVSIIYLISRDEILALRNSLIILRQTLNLKDDETFNLGSLEEYLDNPVIFLELLDGDYLEDTSLYELLRSYMVWLLISEFLYDVLPFEEGLPKDVIKEDTLAVFIKKEEIFFLMRALNILNNTLDEGSSINFDYLADIFDITTLILLASPNDEYRDTYFYEMLQSIIIWHFISNTIYGVFEVPEVVISDLTRIYKTQLVLLAQSLAILVDEAGSEDLDDILSFLLNINNLFNLVKESTESNELSSLYKNTTLYRILTSDIIAYQLTKALLEIDLYLVEIDEEDEKLFNGNIVKRSEVVLFFRGIRFITQDNDNVEENQDFEVNFMAILASAGQLDDDYDKTRLYQGLLSRILQRSISNLLVEILENYSGIVRLPRSVFYDQNLNIIHANEIIYFMRVLYFLNATSYNEVNFDLDLLASLLNINDEGNTSDTKLYKLLNSTIFWFILSSIIDTALNIFEDINGIYANVIHQINGDYFIKKAELVYLLRGITLLFEETINLDNLEDLITPSVDVLDKILESRILHAIISFQILNLSIFRVLPIDIFETRFITSSYDRQDDILEIIETRHIKELFEAFYIFTDGMGNNFIDLNDILSSDSFSLESLAQVFNGESEHYLLRIIITSFILTYFDLVTIPNDDVPNAHQELIVKGLSDYYMLLLTVAEISSFVGILLNLEIDIEQIEYYDVLDIAVRLTNDINITESLLFWYFVSTRVDDLIGIIIQDDYILDNIDRISALLISVYNGSIIRQSTTILSESSINLLVEFIRLFEHEIQNIIYGTD